MPSLLIKNVPEELHRRLRDRAAREHRSLNKEVIVLIEQALGRGSATPLPEPMPLRRTLTPTFILRAKRDGRA